LHIFHCAHARNGRISTYGLKYDVTIVFLGDSRTDIRLLNICIDFQDLLGAKQGKRWCDIDPNALVITLGVLMSVPILVKIDQKMRPWECLQTDTQIHWQTNRRKPISYWTDNYQKYGNSCCDERCNTFIV